MSNCYDMLSLIFSLQKKYAKLAAVQICLIRIHPQLPKLWGKLGDTFELLDMCEVSKSCHEQSQKLYDASEKSLPESFVKEINKAERKTAEHEETVEAKDEEENEFTDLGSSKLRSVKEAEIATRVEKMKVLQHPPPWLEDDDEGKCLHKFIKTFIEARK